MTLIRHLIFPFLRLYWRILKPKTYGVRVIIQHPHSSQILIVRHTYGDQTIWSLPGGGYWPRWESTESAAKREVLEEVGINILELERLGEYKTSAQGKRDTVAVFKCRAAQLSIIPNSEIADFQWIEPQNFAIMKSIYKISKYAMDLLNHKANN